MTLDVDRLWKDLKGDIIIYGIGLYARELCIRYAKDIDNRIKAFVVTNPDGQTSFLGRPVYGLSELNQFYNDEIILVAVSVQYKREIEGELHKCQYQHILYLTDYECNEWDLYKGKSELEYRQFMQSWHEYVDHNIQGTSHGDSKNNKSDTAKNIKQIVFIIGMEMALPRNIKIIRALKRKGYDVVLLCYGGVRGVTVEKELQMYSITIEQCNFIEELMYKMLTYKPLLYYIEPSWGDCSWANVLIQQKEMFGKIVITLYDVFNDGLVFASEQQKRMEQYALENADGIVWRWYSKSQLEKQGMKFSGKSLQFLDYCNGDYKESYEYSSINDEELKLCFICGHPDFLFEEYPKEAVGYIVHARMEDILKKIKNENCCFHFFGWQLSDRAMEKCKELEYKYNNFKAFFGYEHSQLLEIIKKYDYGCFFGTAGREVPENLSVDGRYLGTVLKDAAANKHFDYLDAGLPIVSTIPQKMCEYLSQYNVLIKMDLNSLDIDFLRRNKILYKENVMKARGELSIDNQILRLIDFFDEVALAD